MFKIPYDQHKTKSFLKCSYFPLLDKKTTTTTKNNEKETSYDNATIPDD